MEPIPVGLLGLGAGGRQVADALLASTWCRLAAVGSADASRLREFTALHANVAAFDDFRSLIVSAGVRALFVALPPFRRGPCLVLAARQGLPVWILGAPARRLSEATELIGLFERCGGLLAASRAWGIEPALCPAAMRLPPEASFYLGQACVLSCRGHDLGWRADAGRAGGGVLLDSGYTAVDTLVQAMGLPARVWAAAVRTPVPGYPPRDTEDAAVVVMEYGGGKLAQVLACRTAGPPGWSMDLHAAGASVHIDEERVTTRDPASSEVIGEQARPRPLLLPQVDDFLRAVHTGAKVKSSAAEHLASLTVIEAAYLSARTAHPESPAELLRMHGAG